MCKPTLNDILMRGPTVQEDIFAILICFRKSQYVLTSDIEKMFRQIEISEQDWNLQRVLWRSDPSEPLQTYHLVPSHMEKHLHHFYLPNVLLV